MLTFLITDTIKTGCLQITNFLQCAWPHCCHKSIQSQFYTVLEAAVRAFNLPSLHVDDHHPFVHLQNQPGSESSDSTWMPL